MRLPNKLYSFESSSLAIFPVILHAIGDEHLSLLDVHERTKVEVPSISELIETLVLLRAIQAIEIDLQEGVICRAR